jgi:hypothetical protein
MNLRELELSAVDNPAYDGQPVRQDCFSREGWPVEAIHTSGDTQVLGQP